MLWVQLERTLMQLGLALHMVRVGDADIHRADGRTLLGGMKTDTFRTQRWLDHECPTRRGNRLVRTFGLAERTADALLGDPGRHLVPFRLPGPGRWRSPTTLRSLLESGGPHAL